MIVTNVIKAPLLTDVNSLKYYKCKLTEWRFCLHLLITSVKLLIFAKFLDISIRDTPLLMLFLGFLLYYVKYRLLITNNKSLYRWI